MNARMVVAMFGSFVLMPGLVMALTANEWTGGAGPRADGFYDWNDDANWKLGIPDATHSARLKTVAGKDPAIIDVGVGKTVDVGELQWNNDAKVVVTNGTVRLASGNVKGNMSPSYGVKSALELLADGTWYNDDSWANRVQVYGRVFGDGSITASGNQNKNVYFFDSEVSVPQLQVSLMSVVANAGTRLRGTKILVKGGFVSGSNGTTFSVPNQAGVDVSHYGTFRDNASLEFAGAGGAFTYSYAPVPVEEKLALTLKSGRAYIAVSGATVPNSYVTITNFSRTAGTYLRFQQTLGSAVPLQAENGQGMRISGAMNTPAGVLGIWAFDNYCYLLKVMDAEGTLSSNGYDAYVTTFPTDGGNAWKLVRQTQNEVLASDLELYHLMDSGTGVRVTEIGDYDLTIYGGITYNNWGDKIISATGSGKLHFASDDIFIYSSGSGAMDISAPIVWDKPAGSVLAYPNLVLPSTKSSGVVLSGRDEICDYGNLNMGLGGLLVLDGDAHREFHGELQDCVSVEQRGSGTVTFSGTANGRQISMRAMGGRLLIASNDINPNVIVSNEASFVIGKGVSVTRAPTIWADSYVEGLGTIAASLSSSNIKCDAGFAPGDDGEAGCLTLQGFRPAGDVSLRCRFDATGNGVLKTSGTVTFPADGMKLTVRLRDLTSGGRLIRKDEIFTLFDYSSATKTENVNSEHIRFAIVNESPRSLDVSKANISLDSVGKQILLTGVKSRSGFVLIVR